MPPRVSSTREAGGTPPAALHSIEPEPQSPVVHVNRPLSEEHQVQAQTRPDHGFGTSMELDAPVPSSKPVDESWGPAPVNVAGQIVYGQLLWIVKVAASEPTIREEKFRECKTLKLFFKNKVKITQSKKLKEIILIALSIIINKYLFSWTSCILYFL